MRASGSSGWSRNGPTVNSLLPMQERRHCPPGTVRPLGPLGQCRHADDRPPGSAWSANRSASILAYPLTAACRPAQAGSSSRRSICRPTDLPGLGPTVEWPGRRPTCRWPGVVGPGGVQVDVVLRGRRWRPGRRPQRSTYPCGPPPPSWPMLRRPPPAAPVHDPEVRGFSTDRQPPRPAPGPRPGLRRRISPVPVAERGDVLGPRLHRVADLARRPGQVAGCMPPPSSAWRPRRRRDAHSLRAGSLESSSFPRRLGEQARGLAHCRSQTRPMRCPSSRRPVSWSADIGRWTGRPLRRARAAAAGIETRAGTGAAGPAGEGPARGRAIGGAGGGVGRHVARRRRPQGEPPVRRRGPAGAGRTRLDGRRVGPTHLKSGAGGRCRSRAGGRGTPCCSSAFEHPLRGRQPRRPARPVRRALDGRRPIAAGTPGATPTPSSAAGVGGG